MGREDVDEEDEAGADRSRELDRADRSSGSDRPARGASRPDDEPRSSPPGPAASLGGAEPVSTEAAEPVPPGTGSTDDPDPPRVLEALGQLGVYMAVTAVGLTVVGLGAALLDLYPLANVALVLALVLVSIAMVFGAAYQAVVGNVSF